MTDLFKLKWNALGNIEAGRENLGSSMPVAVYRLMEYSMREALEAELGKDEAARIFRKAGESVGREIAENALDLSQDINGVVAQLQELFKKMQIGVLRIEKLEAQTGTMYMTVSEDLDCSGLPVTGETVCFYDEGMIKGILDAYTSKQYEVREIDCWCTGSRVCRFRAVVKE
ncbi:MAG: 4-vinyl reductase [Hespellia sp.]|nr:4-vinyl reductase [Hespellia sp.]